MQGMHTLTMFGTGSSSGCGIQPGVGTEIIHCGIQIHILWIRDAMCIGHDVVDALLEKCP